MTFLRMLPVAALFSIPQAWSATAVWCGQVLDTESGQISGSATIVVENGRIESVGEPAPADADIVDLSDMTCLPGLIDLHVHLSDQLSERSYLHRYQWGAAQYALNAAANARKTLMAGFTTVRNVGDRHNETVALRDAIAAGKLPGPRIFTAAQSIATTGGHADPTNGYRPGLAGDPGPKEGVANGPAAARKAVRQRYKDGANLIKITATGGVLSLAASGRNPQFTEAELAAIVDTAQDYDMHVAAHAHGAEGMLRAVRAGIDTIEHGTFMNDEIIAAMKQHGTYYVPTILAGKFVGAKAKEPGYFPEVVRPKAAAIGPQITETFGKAYAAGVKIAFGTDTGVSPHGENAREFGYMVEGGMAPAEAIRAATITAAEVLDQSGRLGRIKAGYAADVIAVNGNPLDDVTVLEQVAFVMKNGEIVKSD